MSKAKPEKLVKLDVTKREYIVVDRESMLVGESLKREDAGTGNDYLFLTDSMVSMKGQKSARPSLRASAMMKQDRKDQTKVTQKSAVEQLPVGHVRPVRTRRLKLGIWIVSISIAVLVIDAIVAISFAAASSNTIAPATKTAPKPTALLYAAISGSRKRSVRRPLLDEEGRFVITGVE